MTRALPGIGAHHSALRLSDEWLTPPGLIAPLGRFDLDPASPINPPWTTADRMLTVLDDGLTAPWDGRVWLNPPYSDIAPWMARIAAHNHGTALTFARCDTAWWFDHVWPKAAAFLFIRGRVTFYRVDGTAAKAGHNSGGPSVLIAYGPVDADRLAGAHRAGTINGWLIRQDTDRRMMMPEKGLTTWG